MNVTGAGTVVRSLSPTFRDVFLLKGLENVLHSRGYGMVDD